MKKIFSIASCYCLWAIGSYVFIDLIFGGLKYYLSLESKLLDFLVDNTVKLSFLLSLVITLFCVLKKWTLEKQMPIIKWIFGCALGLYIMPYGLSKILRTQFVVLPFWLWRQPLEKLNGIYLAWSFLGYSPWFQVLLGYLELIPAILLLFTRTRFLGSILLLPMTLNVFLINYALDLWSGTKSLSAQYLSLNIILILFEWKNVRSIIQIVLGKSSIRKTFSWEIIASFILVAGFGFLCSRVLLEYKGQKNFLTGDWINKNPNEWYLKSEKRNDSSVLNPKTLRLYFGSYGYYAEVNGTQPIGNGLNHYEIDEKKHLINLSGEKENQKESYQIINDSTLQRVIVMDSVQNIKLTQIFSRRIINKDEPQ